MQEGSGDRTSVEKEKRGKEEGQLRPQRGGEAATTRFGMEDGDNTDIPATGGPTRNEKPSG